jgi:hypothetical protein
LEAEQSASDLEAGFDEGGPGRQIADAGGGEVPLALEPPDGLRSRIVVASGSVRRGEPSGLEPPLQIGDVIAGVTDGQGK